MPLHESENGSIVPLGFKFRALLWGAVCFSEAVMGRSSVDTMDLQGVRVNLIKIHD